MIDHLAVLREREQYLRARIRAKQDMKWDVQWDCRERDALEWAIDNLIERGEPKC